MESPWLMHMVTPQEISGFILVGLKATSQELKDLTTPQGISCEFGA